MGLQPFVDGNPANDFLGVLETPAGTIVGELNGLTAGSGGGGGGDSAQTAQFPMVPFNPTGDEKGGAGGGGGGAVQLVALGPIIIGASGTITADGGSGGAGENVIFFDRVGGAGGGGSGGMVVLESATRVDVLAAAVNGTGFNQAQPFYTDNPDQARHPVRPISALGGQGGAGMESRCGSNETGPKDWKNDAIPLSAFGGRTDVPPLGSTASNQTFLGCNAGSPTDPEGTVPGGGGDGGPGLIQVHVPNVATDLTVPASTGGDATFSFAPPPLGWTPTGFIGTLKPSHGAVSSTTSTWRSLGAASFDPVSGGVAPMTFTAPGFDPSGSLGTIGGQVDPGVALIAAQSLVSLPGTPAIVPTNPYLILMDASGIAAADDIYQRNPALLRGGSVRLAGGGQSMDFEIIGARYDPARQQYLVIVDTQGPDLASFQPGGTPQASLLTRGALVSVAGQLHSLPAGYDVRVLFDTARAGADGQVDPSTALSQTGGFATDPSSLGAAPWDFMRVRIELERPSSTDRTPFTLQHLQLPFRF